jgi:serine/threonine protein kinase
MEEKERDFWDDTYKRENKIAQKEFQAIYRAKEVSEPFDMVTIKEYTIKEGSNKQKMENLFNREIKLLEYLRSLNCPNFVNYTSYRKDISEEREDNYYFIVREYCFSNLEEFIEMNDGKLEVGLIQLIMKQLNNAFKILTDRKIIHRNIKPSNILICYKENDYYDVKLSGLNYYIKEGENIDISKDIPELTQLEFHPKEFNNPKEKYDLYSIGAIISFMYFGSFNNNTSSIKDKKLKDLVEKCLKDENNRISWNEYFNHPFFKESYPGYEDDDDNNEIENYKKYVIIDEAYKKLETIRNQFQRHYAEVVRLSSRDERYNYFKRQNWKEFDEPIKDFQKKMDEYDQ